LTLWQLPVDERLLGALRTNAAKKTTRIKLFLPKRLQEQATAPCTPFNW
jgi:hypothetical protein